MLTRVGLLIILLGFQSGVVRGQYFYVFSVIETSLKKQPSRMQDAERLRALVAEIAHYGNYTLHWYDFSDSASFTSQVVRKTLETFTPQSSELDVVWFYYAGKGYSDGPKAWPTLQLNGGDLPVRDLLTRFRAKPVRTLLVTTDCGNRQGLTVPLPTDNERIGESRQPKLIAVSPTVANLPQTDLSDTAIIEMSERLFRVKNVRQIIVMASASRGQHAYSSAKHGSVWLKALTQAISDQIGTPSSAESPWKQVQEKVVQMTKLKTNNRQTPQINWTVLLDTKRSLYDHLPPIQPPSDTITPYNA